MKPRRVVITIEVETDSKLKDLVATIVDQAMDIGEILQVQANVIKAKPTKKTSKKNK